MQTTQHIYWKRLLALAAERQVTDMHLVVGAKPAIRIDDQLEVLEQEEVLTQDMLLSFIDSVLNEEQKKRLATNKELIVVYDFLDKNRFRIDITQQRSLWSMSLRFLSSVIRPLPELGFPKEIEDLTTYTHGLVCVAGPQGSGKTTTLAGFVESINRRETKHIVSLEQPIEYVLVNYKSIVEQQEIGVDVTDWESAFAITEQDVDVLVVANVTSATAVKLVLEKAANGILVVCAFESVSTRDMFETMLHVLPEADRHYYAQKLASVYRGSVVQRLVSRIGGGRLVALEVAFASPALRRTIEEQKFDQIDSIIQTSRGEGMILLDRYLAELVSSGQISQHVAQQAALQPALFTSQS